jgi:hypothetical protein
MFLDGTYFQGELTLPQRGKIDNGAQPGEIGYQRTKTVGELSLEWLIERYEEEFLCSLLGLPLYEAWKEGLAAATPAEIWTELKDRIYKVTGAGSFSPAAGYIYFHAMAASVSDTTMTGEKKFKGTFTDNIPVVRKQVKAWNDMCDEVKRVREWVYHHRNDFAALMPDDYRWEYWSVERFDYINEFGI